MKGVSASKFHFTTSNIYVHLALFELSLKTIYFSQVFIYLIHSINSQGDAVMKKNKHYDETGSLMACVNRDGTRKVTDGIFLSRVILWPVKLRLWLHIYGTLAQSQLLHF
jgi:hypothetical protein